MNALSERGSERDERRSVRDEFPNHEDDECKGVIRDKLPNDDAIQKYDRVDWERPAVSTL